MRDFAVFCLAAGLGALALSVAFIVLVGLVVA